MHEIIWDLNSDDETMFCGDPRNFPYGKGSRTELDLLGMGSGATCTDTNPSDGSTCT